jgi:hypothetical protein
VPAPDIGRLLQLGDADDLAAQRTGTAGLAGGGLSKVSSQRCHPKGPSTATLLPARIASATEARPWPSYEERMAVFSPAGPWKPSRDPFKKQSGKKLIPSAV